MASIEGDSAVDTLPVALLSTVIVIALIVAMAAMGIRNVTPSVETASVDRQANAAANDCRCLLSLAPRSLDDPGAPPGAMRIESLDLPEGTEYLSFGIDPDGEGGRSDGTIYYKVCGSKKAIVVDAQVIFRPAMTLKAGHYGLCVEYARDALGRRYLLLSVG